MVPLIYKIGQIGDGWLSIMGRPRAGEWAQDEFSGLARLGVTDVVSLLEPAEARDLDLQDEAKFCSAASIKFYSFPIPDRGVPTSAAELSNFASGLHVQINQGRSFAIHCRAGIGRSSLVAAAVLFALATHQSKHSAESPRLAACPFQTLHNKPSGSLTITRSLRPATLRKESIGMAKPASPNKSLLRSGGQWYLVCESLAGMDKLPMISLGEPPGAELSR